MTITQLEYLIAVDKHRSFAKAAAACYVTQPTLSMQVKKIEEELNVLIFDRSKKPVLTTAIGQQIIQQAKLTIREASRIQELIQNQNEEIKGDLRIGIIPSLSPYLLPLFASRFVRKYPEVSLIIQELLSEQIFEQLREGELDLGILVGPIEDDQLTEIPLFYEPFVVYTPHHHPLSKMEEINPEDLDMDDLWLLREGHCFRTQVINICRDRKRMQPRPLQFESGSLETLKRLVEQQYGYTLLPELAVINLNETQQAYVRRFTKPEPVREVSLLVHRRFMKRRLIELLRETILCHLPSQVSVKEKGRKIPWR